MKRPRRSAAISLFVALAVASAFVSSDSRLFRVEWRASTSALEGTDASQAKDDNLKTLNVGSDLYPPFVYTDRYGDIVGTDVEILTEALTRIGYKPKIPADRLGKEEGAAGERRTRLCKWAALV